MKLGERAFGERAGMWAGLLAVLYRPFIFAVAVPGKEPLAALELRAARGKKGGPPVALCGARPDYI